VSTALDPSDRQGEVRKSRLDGKLHNRVEIMFGTPKDWRRVASRTDRCPILLLSATAVTAAVILSR
jgi:hypothetical protein